MMSEPQGIPIRIDRHTPIRITTRNPYTKEQVNISGAALTFQTKNVLNTGAEVLIDLKNATAGGDATQIEEVDALVSGVYRVHISPDNLTGLDVGGTYWCETKMTSGGKDATIFQEQIVILPSLVD